MNSKPKGWDQAFSFLQGKVHLVVEHTAKMGLESVPNSDNVDSDMERAIEATRKKAKGKGIISPNKGKGVLLKKSVSTTAGKRKRFKEDVSKGPRPSSKSFRTSRTPGIFCKGTGSLKKVIASSGKEKGLSKETRQKVL